MSPINPWSVPWKKSKLRRVANEKSNKALRRLWRVQKGRWPAEDQNYLAWIRMQPCAVCGVFRLGLIQAAHVGFRGAGQKCSDREAIPLCRKHHERGELESHHTLGKRFWLHFGLEREQLIRGYNEAYELATCP